MSANHSAITVLSQCYHSAITVLSQCYHSAINDDMLHIGVLHKMLMHSFPYTLFTPACEALIYAVPVTVVLRQQSPRSTTSCHPQDGLDVAPAIVLLSNVEVWA